MYKRQSLSSIDGLGEKAADGIVFAAEDGPFLSKEDFINRSKVTKTVADLLKEGISFPSIIWKFLALAL